MNGTPNGCTWSRCQRNYPKSGNTTDYPQYLGPQGDVRYVYNFVRCVRNIDTSIKWSKDMNFINQSFLKYKKLKFTDYNIIQM